MCAIPVKAREHFYTDLTAYTKKYAPMLHAEHYSPIPAPFLAASFFYKDSLNVARGEQHYARLDLSFCWGITRFNVVEV